ncbi:MAG: hypothetical protein QME74_07730, partial [Candidatus Edwardsbacteria bacterium]|nr:hypothetical protein [Candidatus Edwardsbacteria bacterium]
MAAAPGKAAGIEFRLKNNLPEQATVTLAGSRAAAVRLELPYQNIVIPAQGFSGSSGTVIAASPPVAGASELTVKARVVTESGNLETKEYAIPVLALGQRARTLLWQDKKRAVWETPGLRLVVKKKGGTISVNQQSLGKRAAILESSYGPPFNPTELTNLEHTVELKDDDMLVISVPSQQNTGLVFIKEIGLAGESALQIRHRLVNGTSAVLNFQLNQTVWALLDAARQRRVIPLADGLVEISGMSSFWPLGEELPKRPGEYCEPWWAWESPDTLVGLVWPGATGIEYPGLTYDFGRIEPGQSAATEACYLMVGQGNHETVRRWYGRHILGRNPGDHAPLPVRPRLRAGWATPVLFLPAGETVERELTVVNDSRSAMATEIALELPRQVSAEPGMIRYDDVALGKSGSARVKLRADGAGPGIGTIRFKVGIEHRADPFGIIPLGPNGSKVTVAKSQDKGLESWTIDNGSSLFKVSPDFLGTLYSWQSEGIEHLLSSFPEPGNFSWERPWYGGLYTMAADPQQWGINLITKEKFTASPLERTGKTGLNWQGIKVASMLTGKTTRGLKLEIEYLTLPAAAGCDLLATVLRIVNPTAAFFDHTVELTGFLCPGGSNRQTRLLWDSTSGSMEISRGDNGAWAEAQVLVAAQAP